MLKYTVEKKEAKNTDKDVFSKCSEVKELRIIDILTNNDDEDDDTYHTQDDHHLLGPEKVVRADPYITAAHTRVVLRKYCS